jgi:hypothetical protein
MSIFQAQISALAEEIDYHRRAAEEAEKVLYELKAAREFALQATAQVQDAIEQIAPKYLELFKEHLLSLFEERCEVELPDISLIEPKEIKPIATVEESVATVEETVEVEKLSEQIFYNHQEETAYVGFSSKQRARNYGDFLTINHTVGSKYLLANQPKYCPNKYELVIKKITPQNAKFLVQFDLKKLPESNSNPFKELKFKPAPVKTEQPTPISQLEVADLIHRGRPNCLYEVEAVKRDEQGEFFVVCRCIQHDSFEGLVGETFTFKEVYLVERAEISVA